MAGVSLQYDLSAVEEINSRIRQLALMDRRGLLDQLGETVVASARLRFRDGTGPDGEEWPVSGRVEREGGQVLVDNAILKNSLTYAVALDGSSVEVGTNLVYAAIHQFGGQAGRGRRTTIPARPFLGLSRDDEAELAAVTDEYLRKVLP